ncbi:hypothetical protein FB567DRAFT_550700 [Paraphoma chrysanthemicola]|uniref:Uncharacterized protein n=1 Tax=Paraphoma chrysanthemicola TaxID=798071 RepID=A0A8K0VWK8_9PLEO|nr:hypothetical protein FB567DRAFT_550700 [Paraphoma chrysanthemicola]
MARSTSPKEAAPAPKRRKLSLIDTLRVRNGGSIDSFISLTAPGLGADSGSDTEEEDNSALEEEYLNRMTDDTDRKIETVFGEDIDVWKSMGGTVYADVNDKIKRKMREKELWGNGQMDKVKVGDKRKAEKITVSFKEDEETGDADVIGKKGKGKKKVEKKAIQPPIPTSPSAPPSIFNPFDPEGAHARPIKPLPKRASKTATTPSILSSLGRVNMEGKAQSSHTHNPNIYQGASPAAGFTNHDVDGVQLQLPLPLPAHLYLHGRFASPTAQRNRDQASTACLPSRRVVSGSFGSFDGAQAGRFDERPYRLLQKGELGSVTGYHDHGFEEQLSSPSLPSTHQHADSLLYTTHTQSPALVQPLILPSHFPIPLDPRRNKLVSGSFGSFSEIGPPSRFDERAYRLLSGQMQGQAGQSEGERGEEGETREPKTKKPDPFKGKVWLR